MEKNFTGWNRLNVHLDTVKEAPAFLERQIWWCSVGVNIGHEEDGKSELFSRPVLVVRKFNERIFWGVPLTTQIKNNPFYHRFYFKEREQCAMLSQLRLWESKRLTTCMGKLPESHFDKVREALRRLI